LYGTIAYPRLKRVDYGSGLILSAATVPGAILGALTTGHIARRPFDFMVGLLLVGISGFLLMRPRTEAGAYQGRFRFERRMVDRGGPGARGAYHSRMAHVITIFLA